MGDFWGGGAWIFRVGQGCRIPGMRILSYLCGENRIFWVRAPGKSPVCVQSFIGSLSPSSSDGEFHGELGRGGAERSEYPPFPWRVVECAFLSMKIEGPAGNSPRAL